MTAVKYKLLIVAVAFLAAFCFACKEKPKDAAPTPPEFIEDLPDKNGPIYARLNDNITVEVSVFPAKYISLDKTNPAEIYAPTDIPFIFEKKVYRTDPVTRIFPIEVKFKVAQDTPYGEHKIKLAMRMYFQNKSDNQPQVRNALVEVPVNVVQKPVTRRRDHTYPMEYKLE